MAFLYLLVRSIVTTVHVFVRWRADRAAESHKNAVIECEKMASDWALPVESKTTAEVLLFAARQNRKLAVLDDVVSRRECKYVSLQTWAERWGWLRESLAGCRGCVMPRLTGRPVAYLIGVLETAIALYYSHDIAAHVEQARTLIATWRGGMGE